VYGSDIGGRSSNAMVLFWPSRSNGTFQTNSARENHEKSGGPIGASSLWSVNDQAPARR